MKTVRKEGIEPIKRVVIYVFLSNTLFTFYNITKAFKIAGFL